MTECGVEYSHDGSPGECHRPSADGLDRCVFHLSPGERAAAGITGSTLRTAFVDDIESDDPTRNVYTDVHLETLDLSALVVDGSDVAPVTFENVTIDGPLDLSGALLRHPMRITGCQIGQLDTAGATFEMDVTIEESTLGAGSGTAFDARRGTYQRSLHLSDTDVVGSVECPACEVAGWLDVDGVSVTGGAHFPNLSVGTMQFVSAVFEDGVEFAGATGGKAIFERVHIDDQTAVLDLSGVSFDLLRVAPGSDLTCTLESANVSTGRLEQAQDAASRYDLTRTTLGEVDLDCEAATFDRYRFYRTRFDGFPFASYREVLRSNHWRIQEYSGTPSEASTNEGLEHTYLEAKQGASRSGDSETASMFFVREMRYRRRRYRAHATATKYSLRHRFEAAMRWMTNGFLDAIAGYGERPQRTLLIALALILGSALTYPAAGGLVTGEEIVRYSTHGIGAILDGLYFSVVTFATLGLGDVHPAGDIGRFIAASEGLAGAFLTAIFVFSLGRRVTR
jgi:uncharacterized protein YjbI with pentapeptide repeats